MDAQHMGGLCRALNRPGGTSAYEPGLNVLRSQPGGSWQIVPFIAYAE